MALSIIKPFVHVEDANGNPYVGAKLYIYLPGTTTPASIYSDEGLSIALSNPLTGVTGSDAAGNFPRAYIAAGRYKLRAETSASVLIWEMDNIDTGLSAGSGALPIASGGTGGTTAAAARTNLDVPSNADLTTLSTIIATLQSSLQNIVSTPQGRLTLTSATPILAAGVTAGTSVYYTPYLGNLIPIYDGTQFNTTPFSELTLTLNSSHTASNIYDVFVFSNSGVLTLVTGPAWNTATAGSGARGTGAGTTELTRTKGGLWTNAFAMTARNGATTYSVNQYQATYVGSLYIDGTNGQISCLLAYGQNRKWGVWNAYNRVPIIMQAGDGTASWSYSTSAWRASDNDANNKLTTFIGLPEELIDVVFEQVLQITNNNSTCELQIGIGFNSTSSPSGKLGRWYNSTGIVGAVTVKGDAIAEYIAVPALGITNFSCLENGLGSGGTATFVGTSSFMMMKSTYRG